MVALELYPFSAADLEYVNALATKTLRGYVETDRGEWDPESALEKMSSLIHSGAFFEIRAGGVRVGALAKMEAGDHIQLEALFIEPHSQRKGIGRWVVEDVISEATAKKLPVRLRVFVSNPAVEFYEKLGFQIVGRGNGQHYMQLDA